MSQQITNKSQCEIKKQKVDKVISRYRTGKQQNYENYEKDDSDVHLGNGLNYSLIYSALKLQKIPKNPQNQQQNSQQQIKKEKFNFNSAVQIGQNKQKTKKLYAIDIHSTQRSTKKQSSRQFRVSQARNINESKNYDRQSSRSSFLNAEQKKMTQNYTVRQNINNSNRKSIGVGGHRIYKQDLQFVQGMSSLEQSQYQQQAKYDENLCVFEDESSSNLINNQQIPIQNQEKQQVLKPQTTDKVQSKLWAKLKSITFQKQISQNSSKNTQHSPEPEKEEQNTTPIETLTKQSKTENKVIQKIENVNNITKCNNNQIIFQDQLKFDIVSYAKVYDVLKSMHSILKSPTINSHELLKNIKNYLELMAYGNLDNIDAFDIPLQKKKIIKQSLFLERASIITVSFAFSTHFLKNCIKSLINLLGYSVSNCLIVAKILEQSNFGTQNSNKEANPQNLAKQKFERLLIKKDFDTVKNNNNILNDLIHKISKSQQTFHENISQIIKESSKINLQQIFYNLLEDFSFYLCYNNLQFSIPFLSVAPNPYLPLNLLNQKYTLVIDFMEVFCNGSKKSKSLLYRPFSQHFINQMSQYFNIVSFSAAFPSQIDKIIDMFNQKGQVKHRLYKHHTVLSNRKCVKYLDRLGTKMEETILLDNENEGGDGSKSNCLNVPTWKGNRNDTILAELCPVLAMIAIKKIPVQKAITEIRRQTLQNKKDGIKYFNFGMFFN